MTRHFLSIDDVSAEELNQLLERAAKMKQSPAESAHLLEGRQVAVLFEKPSTRTRVPFEVAITSTGAFPVILSADELQLGRGETLEDTARVMSRYVDAIAVRTFGQERLEALATAGTIPVINALSDYEHPCQTLADLLTVVEQKGDPAGKTIAYLGDGNNVAHSLLLGAAKMGMHVRVATPPGFEPIPQVVERAQEIGAETGGSAEITSDARAAADGADVLYTDVWASMGQEEEHNERVLVMTPYRIDASAVERAADDAIVMHCLPAHRGEEITDDVIDGPRSVVWDQAENKLHVAKALLAWLLG